MIKRRVGYAVLAILLCGLTSCRRVEDEEHLPTLRIPWHDFENPSYVFDEEMGTGMLQAVWFGGTAAFTRRMVDGKRYVGMAGKSDEDAVFTVLCRMISESENPYIDIRLNCSIPVKIEIPNANNVRILDTQTGTTSAHNEDRIFPSGKYHLEVYKQGN